MRFYELFSVIDIEFNGIKITIPAGYPKLFSARIPNDCPSLSHGTNRGSPPTQKIYLDLRTSHFYES